MFFDPYVYLGVGLAGLASFLSPCVLPLVPPYLGFLGGTTVSQAAVAGGLDPLVWRRIVFGSFAFVLGFTTVFVALGASASLIGQVLRIYQAELSMLAGAIIVLFGLHFIGVLRVPILYRDVRYHSKQPSASLLGAYVIGLAFAFGWTPCIGPVLGAVLALAASDGTLWAGASLLLVYSLGLGVPFVFAAIAVRPFLAFSLRFYSYLATVEKIMGVVLIVTGLLFISGSFNSIGQWLLETFPLLANIEEWVTPDSLRTEILRQRGGS